jgi:REP element-mobilizing transposase RayT
MSPLLKGDVTAVTGGLRKERHRKEGTKSGAKSLRRYDSPPFGMSYWAGFKAVSQCKIFAYCLMDNHVHLLLQETKETISMIIQRISSSYVRWYNAKHKRCGHLFQERFKSEVVENDSYFLTVLRYIHQNPIKAKIVRDMAEYRWSSYNEYIKRNKMVEKEYVLVMFANKRDEAIKRFVRFVEEINEDNCLEISENKSSLSDADIRSILKHQFGVEAIKIRNEVREKQDYLLHLLKEVYSLTVRRIARITGFSSTRIWRA